MKCHDCAGTVILESESNRHPKSLGVEIPVDACDMCYQEGIEQYDKAKKSDFATIQFINRVDKEYIYK